MKNLTLTAAMASACLGLAACDSANDATTSETADPAATHSPADSAAETVSPSDRVVIDNEAGVNADPDGTTLSVGPDGTELDIDEGEVDANVDTDGDVSGEIEF